MSDSMQSSSSCLAAGTSAEAMIQKIASFAGNMAKIQGAARSGKTEALVQRCCALLKQGIEPTSILVEVTSAFAAQAFRQRLFTAADVSLSDAARNICVSSALTTCVTLLDSPEARAFTGRVPRLLNSAEYNFFLEDMKTLGQPVRRLRAILKHFSTQWSALAPQTSWLIGAEEETVYEHLQAVLTQQNAMLADEAAPLCVSYLKSLTNNGQRPGFDYVLCDDFQNLSNAEQACLCLLARKQLIVCGNANQTVAARASHPHPTGFTHFETTRRNVNVFNLPGSFSSSAVASFADALCTHNNMDSSLKTGVAPERSDDVVCIKWNTPEDEIDGLTKYLRVLLDEEATTPESRTCVLVPNRQWARLFKRVLLQRGFSVSDAGTAAGLGGDPRDTARAQALVAYVKLTLVANPQDMTAWRCWCGFNNYLTNSDAWNNLMEFATERNLSLYDALTHVGEATDEPFLRAGVLAAAWHEGQEIIQQNAARKGFALMRAIGAEGLPEFDDLADSLAGDETAATLYARAREAVTNPAFPDDPHTLRIATYQTLSGTEYDNLFAVSLVDGFMPRRDAFEVVSTDTERERIVNDERRAFYNAVSKASKRLVLSFFSKAPLELAERANMHVTRVKAEDGQRIAATRPSMFLSEAGNACPGTIGGQSVLAERGLN